MPANGTDPITGFTGLALSQADGSLSLVENGVTKATIAYTGSFNSGTIHNLSYTIDTVTGAISNVMLGGSTSTYSFSSTAFTNAATNYVTVGNAEGGVDGTCTFVDNFIVSGTTTVDDFNRGNSSDLGSNWQVPRSFQPAASLFQYRRPTSPGFEVSSQRAVSFTAPAAPFAAEQVAGQSFLNPTVQADVTLGSASAIGLFARAQIDGDAYVAVLISGKAQIWLFHGGTGAITVLGTATYTATPPTTITFTVTGSGTSTTLSLTDGTGNLSLTVTGSTLTTLNNTGGVGIFAQGAGGTVDNFSVSGT
jgi:hypothetical protein